MKKLYKIILICSLLLVVGFFINKIDSKAEIVPFVAAGNYTINSYNCPPECEWGCYPNGECCPEPEPGQPWCSSDP